MNVGKILEESVSKFEDKVALFFEDERISFRELGRLVNNLSAGLNVSVDMQIK